MRFKGNKTQYYLLNNIVYMKEIPIVNNSIKGVHH